MNPNYDRRENLDLGVRKVGTIHFSKVVTLPKAFTDNYLDESGSVKVSISTEGKLILAPIRQAVKKGGIKE